MILLIFLNFYKKKKIFQVRSLTDSTTKDAKIKNFSSGLLFDPNILLFMMDSMGFYYINDRNKRYTNYDN